MKHSSDLFTPMPNHARYVGLMKNATLVSGTSKTTSGENVSVFSGSMFSTLYAAAASVMSSFDFFLAHKSTEVSFVDTIAVVSEFMRYLIVITS